MFFPLIFIFYGFTALFQPTHIFVTIAFWLMYGVVSTLTKHLMFSLYFKIIDLS